MAFVLVLVVPVMMFVVFLHQQVYPVVMVVMRYDGVGQHKYTHKYPQYGKTLQHQLQR